MNRYTPVVLLCFTSSGGSFTNKFLKDVFSARQVGDATPRLSLTLDDPKGQEVTHLSNDLHRQSEVGPGMWANQSAKKPNNLCRHLVF